MKNTIAICMRDDYVREQLKRYKLRLKDIRAYYIDSCGAAEVRITRDFKVLYKRANGWLYAEGESWLHGGWIDRDLLEQIRFFNKRKTS